MTDHLHDDEEIDGEVLAILSIQVRKLQVRFRRHKQPGMKEGWSTTWLTGMRDWLPNPMASRAETFPVVIPDDLRDYEALSAKYSHPPRESLEGGVRWSRSRPSWA